MLAVVKLSLTNNTAIFPNYIIMKWSTDPVLYCSCYKCHEMVYRSSTILQLLQVSCDHHLTSILTTLAQTIYNIKYGSQNSTVGIVTVLIDSSTRFYPCPKWLCCPYSFLFNVYHHFILWDGMGGEGAWVWCGQGQLY